MIFELLEKNSISYGRISFESLSSKEEDGIFFKEEKEFEKESEKNMFSDILI